MALRALQSKQVQDNESLSAMATEMEALQSQVTELTDEIEAEKREVLRAESELREWEERVRSCKVTINAVRGGSGDLESLRGEVNLLRSRAELCEREARALSVKMADAVGRRGQMADRLERRAEKKSFNSGHVKVLTAKKADDLKMRLRRLCKDEDGLKV